MKILVYGAGNIGRLYAGLLAGAGHEVSILARGSRLSEIRENGIRLERFEDAARSTHEVRAVSRLDPDEAYELVLVALPQTAIEDVLPLLAAHSGTPNVMFFGNEARGPDALTKALGRQRVLLGFPGAAAFERDGWLRFLIVSRHEQPTTIGELDGSRTERIETIAGVLGEAGFPVSICSNMNAWLLTHAAKIVPTSAALCMADFDLKRLVRSRDALVLMVRAIREGFRVLSAHGTPIVPANHRVLEWLPEPLLVFLMRRMLGSESMAIKIGHARGSRPEMRDLAGELERLARSAGIETPAADRLYRHLEDATPPLPDGSAEIPVRRTAVYVLLAALVSIGMLLVL